MARWDAFASHLVSFWYGRGEGIAMTIHLGIDGGGSGCRAAVARAGGGVLGRGDGAAANIVTDPEGARAAVLAAAGAALAEAGVADGPGDCVAVLGLAGANLTASAVRFAASLPFARTRVVSDALVAVRGALGAADGVTAAIGTGSVFAAQRAGAVRFIGGWGFVLGDHASGARLGRSLFEAALLAHDGLRPASPMLTAALAEAGGPEGLVAWARTARPADFAAHAPRIVAAAAEGDAAAQAILAGAEAQVAAAIDHLLDGAALPVCFLGGLGPVFAARLAGRYGDMIRPAAGSSTARSPWRGSLV
jgi:glucosamine kinase